MLGMCTFGWMVGWTGAMPKSSHHRGLARLAEGEKMVSWCPCSKILQAQRVAMGGGGVYIRLVVGHTWTWASLGFRTGLVCMQFSSWLRVAG